ncbi:hypothetical protein BJ741DRAFT_710599 [Chytriomyces cf. hyalinus JEL632]|nr:hypothetical protein BJ741DRAFT_710599 [Chytriomyces cf. hyalinus JEL632]
MARSSRPSVTTCILEGSAPSSTTGLLRRWLSLSNTSSSAIASRTFSSSRYLLQPLFAWAPFSFFFSSNKNKFDVCIKFLTIS